MSLAIKRRPTTRCWACLRQPDRQGTNYLCSSKSKKACTVIIEACGAARNDAGKRECHDQSHTASRQTAHLILRSRTVRHYSIGTPSVSGHRIPQSTLCAASSDRLQRSTSVLAAADMRKCYTTATVQLLTWGGVDVYAKCLILLLAVVAAPSDSAGGGWLSAGCRVASSRPRTASVEQMGMRPNRGAAGQIGACPGPSVRYHRGSLAAARTGAGAETVAARRGAAVWPGRELDRRRPHLLSGLPDAALAAVRGGNLSSWAANPVMAPLERAKADHAVRLLAGAGVAPLSTGGVAELARALPAGSGPPASAWSANPACSSTPCRRTRTGSRRRNGPGGACIDDLRCLEAVIARLRKRVATLRPVPPRLIAAAPRPRSPDLPAVVNRVLNDVVEIGPRHAGGERHYSPARIGFSR